MALVETLHEMILGVLPVDFYESPQGWRMDVLAAGQAPGSPEAVVAVMNAFTTDGSIARRERMENATTAFKVMITGPTHDHLVMGEEALAMALPDGSEDEPTPFLWRPADGSSSASVRDVVLGHYDLDFEDLNEIQSTPRRIFTVRLTHLPFVRTEFPVVFEAPYVGEVPTTVVVDECDSATGWSATTVQANGTVVAAPVTAGSGAVSMTAQARMINPTWRWGYRYTMSRSGLVDFTSTPYLVVEATTSQMTMTLALAGGVTISPMATTAIDGTWSRYVYDMTGRGSVALGFAGDAAFETTSPPPPGRVKSIRRIVRTDNPESSATPRQSSRTLKIEGTARTPGAVHVASRDGETNLDFVMVHTCPSRGDGQQSVRDLWPHRTGGPAGSTADATAPMGARQPLHASTSLVAQIPASDLPPSSYTLALLINSASAQRIVLSGFVGGVAPAGGSAFDVEPVACDIDVPAGISLVSYHGTSLPSLATTAGKVYLSLLQPTGTPVEVIGWYALRSDSKSSLFAGKFAHPYLWIDSRRAGKRGHEG
ncbi:MAG: hypothetical protein ACI39M_00280, partial [Streptomyces albidoflavus]